MANALIERIDVASRDYQRTGKFDDFLLAVREIIPAVESIEPRAQVLYLVFSVSKILASTNDTEDLRAVCTILDRLCLEPEDVNTEKRLLVGGLRFLLSYAFDDFERRTEAPLSEELLAYEEKYPLVETSAYFICSEYEIEEKYLRDIEDIRLGSSSVIFRCSFGVESWVVKFIRYEYITELPVIEDLGKYRDFCAENSDIAPALIAPNNLTESTKWIVIADLGQTTMRDRLDRMSARWAVFSDRRRGARKNTELPAILREKRDFCSHLIRTVSNLGQRNHFDITPENIVINELEEDEDLLSFIDFGVNSLLARGGGGSAATAGLVYMSPEVQRQKPEPKFSDLYSVGVILLEVLLGRRLRPNDLDDAIDECWTHTPHVASIIEDCLTEDFRTRGLNLTPRDAEGNLLENQDSVFKALGEVVKFLFDKDIQNAEKSELKIVHEGWTRLGELIGKLVKAEKTFESQFLAGVFSESLDRRLAWWTLVCLISFGGLLVVSFSVIPTNSTAGISYLDSVRALLGIEPFTVVEGLPGRIICVSFAITATIYYINIFRQLHVPQDLSWDHELARESFGAKMFAGRRRANLVMRLNAFCFAPPILYALVLDPRAWPVCSFVGLACVALNNAVVSKTAEIMFGQLPKELRLTSSQYVKNNLILFKGWGTLVISYAFGILILQEFFDHLKEELPRDTYLEIEALLVLFVVGINLGKMVGVNCIKFAPQVRIALHRTFEADRRLQLMLDAKTLAAMGRLKDLAQEIPNWPREKPFGTILVLSKDSEVFNSWKLYFAAYDVALEIDSGSNGKWRASDKTLIINPMEV